MTGPSTTSGATRFCSSVAFVVVVADLASIRARHSPVMRCIFGVKFRLMTFPTGTSNPSGLLADVEVMVISSVPLCLNQEPLRAEKRPPTPPCWVAVYLPWP
jgi:hypothetical protein